MLLVSFSALLLATAVHAQVIEPPRRVFQPRREAGRLLQDLTFETDLLGGRDDNPTPGGVAEFTDRPGGYTGQVTTRLSYRVGRGGRFLEAAGGGSVDSFRNLGLKPAYGSYLAGC